MESEILYFEERIRWETRTGGDSGHIAIATYYNPIISYSYLGSTFIYKPKVTASLKIPDFNTDVEIFIQPENPKNAKHKYSNATT
ncbi:hypothetical protein HX109_12925 [Galbibacter sp. BG1]|uniref:hypothetical protein n=1 Tax=Galbibacter sp. BG1 TaxID=1170699 RepID=UPI0015BBDC20|nr:hypothetical protein [Galbibacter sp. BG1]QLE02415.1 hypothetical protein HX109_12925 [Galbibacter sp. BG1]